MFSIANHHLNGPVKWVPSPNFNGDRTIAPRFLVFHYTVIAFDAAVRVFSQPGNANPVSAHIVVSRSGEVVQMVDFNRRAWHAGTSSWAGLNDINSHAIGIELENFGYLYQTGDGIKSVNGDPVPPADAVISRHKNPVWTQTHWQAYSPEQLSVAKELAQVLVGAYGLTDIVGHDDISPGRKADPGPAFAIDQIEAAAFGREQHLPEQLRYRVAADFLNIRSGPGKIYSLADAPLSKGTAVRIIETTSDGWTRVEALKPGGVTGWVYGQYLEPGI